MNHENEYSLVSVNSDRFRLRAQQGLSPESIKELLHRSEELPAPDFAANRQRGKLRLENKGQTSDVFVKRYSATDAQSTAFKRRHPLHRLRRRYAFKEGSAYVRFGLAGIPVPRVVLFGEEWLLGIRGSGVVVVDFLEGPSVQDALLESDPGYWVENVTASVIKMHQFGYTHGDANLINFIATNHQSYAIDLENSRPVTDKKRSSDLINVVKSIEFATDDRKLADSVLSMYEQSGLKLPRGRGDLLQLARQKAERQRLRDAQLPK